MLLRATTMSAPTKQPVNALDRSAQRSATQSIVQPKETSDLQAQADSAEVPVGVLELPVRVWGSRRITSDSGQPERIEVLAEETCTVIVFPHGAVIRLSAAVEPGQLMMIANRKSHQNVLCRVVNVKKYPSARGYAEIEFLQPANGFWEAYIPQGTLKLTERARILAATSEQPAKPSPVSPKPVSPQPWVPTRSATSSKPPTASENSWSLSYPTEKNPAPANASSISFASPPTVRTELKPIHGCAIETPSVEKQVQSAAATATASVSRPEAKERNVSKPLFSPAVANSGKHAVTSTRKSKCVEFANERSARSSVQELFGWLLGEVLARTARGKAHPPRRTLVPMGATLVGLFTIGAAGILLLHRSSTQSATTQTSPAPVASTVSALANAVRSLQPESNSSTIVREPRITVKAEGFPGLRSQELADNVRIFQPPTRKPTSVGKTLNGRLLAPNLIERRSDAAIGRDVAPDVAAGDPNISASAIQGVLAALSPVGGRMREPRLVTRSVPSYPAAARQVGIEGDVAIDAVIDTDGKLTNLKVVSGAPLLQQAALDSLRNWKYEPGYLDDKPVPVKTSITVKFRLR